MASFKERATAAHGYGHVRSGLGIEFHRERCRPSGFGAAAADGTDAEACRLVVGVGGCVVSSSGCIVITL